MTAEQKNRIAEIDSQIASLMKEKETINPYSNLKSFSNKNFGEA